MCRLDFQSARIFWELSTWSETVETHSFLQCLFWLNIQPESIWLLYLSMLPIIHNLDFCPLFLGLKKYILFLQCINWNTVHIYYNFNKLYSKECICKIVLVTIRLKVYGSKRFFHIIPVQNRYRLQYVLDLLNIYSRILNIREYAKYIYAFQHNIHTVIETFLK